MKKMMTQKKVEHYKAKKAKNNKKKLNTCIFILANLN